MKFYGKAKETCEKIINQFKDGDVPEVLKNVYVNRSDNIPAAKWSFQNRFLAAVNGASDARGFRQWQKAGRQVSKGSKAFHILGPCVGKKKDANGEETPIIFGFKSIPVFSKDSTEIADQVKWEKAGGIDLKEEKRLEAMPFYNLAKSWGLEVTSYNGKGGKILGSYSYGKGIAVGTENWSTWAHELIHAADDKAGNITMSSGQDTGNEIVAELGGAALLKMIGEDYEADLGGAWKYVSSYGGKDTLSLCTKLLDRISKALDLVFSESKNLN